jgi:hypothetical protein
MTATMNNNSMRLKMRYLLHYEAEVLNPNPYPTGIIIGREYPPFPSRAAAGALEVLVLAAGVEDEAIVVIAVFVAIAVEVEAIAAIAVFVAIAVEVEDFVTGVAIAVEVEAIAALRCGWGGANCHHHRHNGG